MLAVLVQHVSAANEHPGQTHGHVSDLQDRHSTSYTFLVNMVCCGHGWFMQIYSDH